MSEAKRRERVASSEVSAKRDRWERLDREVIRVYKNADSAHIDRG